MYGRVEIDDETKKKLSLLLKYYRKKANLNQRDFITYNGATICSADTYSKIENCKIIKSNSIYHYLLVQIHAELNLPSSWWEPWSTCFQELLELVTRYDLAGLAERCAALFAQLVDEAFHSEIRLVAPEPPECARRKVVRTAPGKNRYLCG